LRLFGIKISVVTDALFAERNRTVVRRFGRIATGEAEQESALGTATINRKIQGNEIFAFSTAGKTASSGVLKE
jgi:hypothetical protein